MEVEHNEAMAAKSLERWQESLAFPACDSPATSFNLDITASQKTHFRVEFHFKGL